jgi:hypothetical protein
MQNMWDSPLIDPVDENVRKRGVRRDSLRNQDLVEVVRLRGIWAGTTWKTLGSSRSDHYLENAQDRKAESREI